MNLTTEQLAKAKEAKSLEELTALAKAESVETAPGEIEAFWNALHAEGELADEELDSVSGGCNTYVLTDAVNSADPRCVICGSRLVYYPEGMSTYNWNDREYQCDEFRCPYANHCFPENRYLHLWEGDRWLVQK